MSDSDDEEPRTKKPDKAYAVGKGKPPVEHQFKKGNKGGGRKPGSRNKHNFYKLYEERIQVGEDRLGRAIMKPFGEVIDRQLFKKAAQGDLAAIRIVKEFQIKLAAFERTFGPRPQTAAEAAEAQREEAKKIELSWRLTAANIDILELLARLKKSGIVDCIDGHWAIVPEAERRNSKNGTKDPPSTG